MGQKSEGDGGHDAGNGVLVGEDIGLAPDEAAVEQGAEGLGVGLYGAEGCLPCDVAGDDGGSAGVDVIGADKDDTLVVATGGKIA